MTFSIRLTDEEKTLAESYAKMHSFSLAEGKKSRLIDELWRECDL